MWRGVKSHVALMQRHLKRFIDHFIDLISCGRAKIKLDTAMTFTATSLVNRVVLHRFLLHHVSLCIKIGYLRLKQFSI